MSDPVAVSRKLVAVFAADVEGYSRLMGGGLPDRRRGGVGRTACGITSRLELVVEGLRRSVRIATIHKRMSMPCSHLLTVIWFRQTCKPSLSPAPI
jgi:hypothetical protein